MIYFPERKCTSHKQEYPTQCGIKQANKGRKGGGSSTLLEIMAHVKRTNSMLLRCQILDYKAKRPLVTSFLHDCWIFNANSLGSYGSRLGTLPPHTQAITHFHYCTGSRVQTIYWPYVQNSTVPEVKSTLKRSVLMNRTTQFFYIYL